MRHDGGARRREGDVRTGCVPAKSACRSCVAPIRASRGEYHLVELLACQFRSELLRRLHQSHRLRRIRIDGPSEPLL